MAVAQIEPDRLFNPLELVEQLAAVNDWMFERSGEDEISLSVAGSWADYQISFNWRDDLEALHLACAFDMKVPQARQPEFYRLLAQINERLWIGHFDLWSLEGLVMFRHGLMLNGGASPTSGQCEAMLGSALEACEQYFQTFQFVIWAGMDADKALTSSMFETAGQA